MRKGLIKRRGISRDLAGDKRSWHSLESQFVIWMVLHTYERTTYKYLDSIADCVFVDYIIAYFTPLQNGVRSVSKTVKTTDAIL